MPTLYIVARKGEKTDVELKIKLPFSKSVVQLYLEYSIKPDYSGKKLLETEDSN